MMNASSGTAPTVLPNAPNGLSKSISAIPSDPKNNIVMGTPPRSPSLFTPAHFHYALSSLQSPTFDTPRTASFSSLQFLPKNQQQQQSQQRRLNDTINSELPPRCKIICTMGPSCQSVPRMTELVIAGMNVVRMNFSHGDHAYHMQTIVNIREVQQQTRRIVAILLDTKGPEIRTGKLENNANEVQLKRDQSFILTTDESFLTKGTSEKVFVAYKNLPNIIKPGQHVLIDDGLIDCVVQKCTSSEVHVRVINNGMLGGTKGVNLPGVVVDLPAVTQKDIDDITFGVAHGIDFIAASFVRKASDVTSIRDLLSTLHNGSSVKIISKIESQEGLDNFDEILEVSDGIMVARGDLGVEIPIDQVALAQKMIIRKCNLAGKFVITATQMLESMIKNPSPTRAEASDVANAVLDGTDCVMLSGETAKGAYPVESVKMMADICREAEFNVSHQTHSAMIRDEMRSAVSIMEAIASSAVRATFELRASIIIVLTETGSTARLVSKYRPAAPILTVTSSEQTARQSLVSRGLFPLLVGSMVGSDSLINRVLLAAIRLGMCKQGDLAVVTSGSREATAGQTNDLKVVQVSC